MLDQLSDSPADAHGIAIIGMAGRFPGASDLPTFWHNLCAGVEAITRFRDADLRAEGEDPALLQHPHYVNAGGVLDDIAAFDAAFFGCTPREAEILDPQQRLFLECAWEALEQAGYIVTDHAPPIGVFAGTGISTYFLTHLYQNPDVLNTIGKFQLLLSNDKDFLPTRVSYKLNLRGPSVSVNTAGSTSLVAIHFACQSLLNAECSLALAGGVSVRVPHRVGYWYHHGGVHSPDGHCRAFAADAAGTVPGNGVGVVVLKRLAEARADGDPIHAIIRSSAVNNDGAERESYTAPSVAGQAAVIAEALSLAEAAPHTITYVEPHGNATAWGDPTEIAALTQAFGSSKQRGWCAVGSLKTNLGHLDAAAGVAGLIKTVLALQHRQIPPSLHCAQPNPEINFAATPFYVNTRLRDWPAGPTPRRAAVGGLGIGGTNAYVIVEEAPPAAPAAPSRPWHLLTLSAQTPSALDTLSAQLAAHLAAHPDLPLADVAYTLQVGRRAFPYRRAVVCATPAQAQAALTGGAPDRVLSGQAAEHAPGVVLLLPELGEPQLSLGRDLAPHTPVVRAALARCAALAQPLLGCDLRAVLYSEHASPSIDRSLSEDAALADTRLFAIEYALAQLWMSWGIQPQAVLGYGLGEYVAATLAGVFTLDAALKLVVARARLIATLPSKEHHSSMMESIAEQMRGLVESTPRQAPQLRYLSNVTGTWIRAAEATDPAYWARQLCAPVRLDRALATLRGEAAALVEVGPGFSLGSAAVQQGVADVVVPSLPLGGPTGPALPTLLASLGQLWLAGVAVDWAAVYGDERRRRVVLPTYPFERQRFWIDRRPEAEGSNIPAHTSAAPSTCGEISSPEYERIEEV